MGQLFALYFITTGFLAALSGPAQAAAAQYNEQACGFVSFTKMLEVSEAGPKYDIFTLNLKTQEERKITNSGSAAYASWSWTGEEFSFFGNDNRGVPQIFVQDLNNSFFKKIPAGSPDSNHKINSGCFPNWSPSGYRIAFEGRNVLSTSGDVGCGSAKDYIHSSIWIMNSNGQHLERLTGECDDPSCVQAFDSAPSWSKDLSRIAFHSNRHVYREVYTVDVKTKKVERITDQGGPAGYPKFSPTHNKIAFEGAFDSKGEDQKFDIYVVNLDQPNSKPRRITCGPENYAQPSWSPDGSKIIFTAISADINKAEIYSADLKNCSIDCCDLKSESVTRLTDNNKPDFYPSFLKGHCVH